MRRICDLVFIKFFILNVKKHAGRNTETFIKLNKPLFLQFFQGKICFQRRKVNVEKMEAMISYVTAEQCRTVKILKYFDEADPHACGICDVCLNKKKIKKNTSVYKLYRERVLRELEGGAMELNVVISKLAPSSETELIDCIRLMISSGEIKYNREGFLELDV